MRARGRNTCCARLLAERADGSDDFAAVASVLGRRRRGWSWCRSRTCSASTEQINVPGTVDEHPNWRRKLTVPLEELEQSTGLKDVAAAFRATGRAAG